MIYRNVRWVYGENHDILLDFALIWIDYLVWQVLSRSVLHFFCIIPANHELCYRHEQALTKVEKSAFAALSDS